MYLYLAYAFALQPSYRPAHPTILEWLNGRLANRRARIAKRNAIAYLRTLDRHALNDMGVDIAALSEIVPRLIASNPNNALMPALTPPMPR